MNVKVFTSFDQVGLLCDCFVEASSEPVSEFSAAYGRGTHGTLTTARVVPKAANYGRQQYMTDEEKSDLDLFHTCRHAGDDARDGRATDKQRKLAYVFQNIRRWCKLREFDAAVAGGILQAGWWRKAVTGSKDLAELASLIRCLDHVSKTDENDIANAESPYADADNGQCAY